MIEAQYKLTFDEWAEAQNLWCKREASRLPATKLLLAIYYGLTVLSGVAMALPPYWPGVAIFALLIAQSLLVSWRKKRIRQFLYAEASDRDKDVLLHIDEAGYESVRPGFNECRMSWECFTGWREGKLTFILGRGMQYCSVPKSALTADQIAELRFLLNEKLSR